MDLLIDCSIDNLQNNSTTDVQWVIKNVRYRKCINRCTIVGLFYKKFFGKHLYLRNILKTRYIIEKR